MPPETTVSTRPSAGDLARDRSRSFAELIATLDRLNALESAIVDIVSRSEVPRIEVRRLLRCATSMEAENTPAVQFMRQVFRQVGLTVSLVKVHPFSLSFEVPHSPYIDLVRTPERKPACHLTAEAISRFFTRDLGIGCTTQEVTCLNAGDTACTFTTVLKQGDVRELLLDRTDRMFLKSLHGGETLDEARRSLDLAEPELEVRLGILARFGLVTRSGQLTEAGNREARSPLPNADEEDVAPPWRELEQISEAVSYAASFAEAARETLPVDITRAPLDEALGQEARGARSFAELLGRKARHYEDEDTAGS